MIIPVSRPFACTDRAQPQPSTFKPTVNRRVSFDDTLFNKIDEVYSKKIVRKEDTDENT